MESLLQLGACCYSQIREMSWFLEEHKRETKDFNTCGPKWFLKKMVDGSLLRVAYGFEGGSVQQYSVAREFHLCIGRYCLLV